MLSSNISKVSLLVLSFCFWTVFGQIDHGVSYEEYLRVFEKDESRSKDSKRIEIFTRTQKYIQEHHEAIATSYSLRLNQFSDMSTDELSHLFQTSIDIVDDTNKRRRTMGIRPSTARRILSESNTVAPAHINWSDRTHNPTGRQVVSEVGDQGLCGACWAYTSVYATEASVRIGGSDVSLSVQELLDCDQNGTRGLELGATSVNSGCSGGNPIRAFKYIHKYGLGEKYTYGDVKAQSQQCMMGAGHLARREEKLEAHRHGRDALFVSSKSDEKAGHDALASITSFEVLPSGDEALMRDYVGRVGPVTIGVCGSDPRFMYYGEGVLDVEDCCSTLNHAVLVVGYGTQDGTDYWLVQNSWSKKWGDNGFIKIKRYDQSLTHISSLHHKGVCGAALSVAVPIGGFLLSSEPGATTESPPFSAPVTFADMTQWLSDNGASIILCLSGAMFAMSIVLFAAALRVDHRQWQQRLGRTSDRSEEEESPLLESVNVEGKTPDLNFKQSVSTYGSV